MASTARSACSSTQAASSSSEACAAGVRRLDGGRADEAEEEAEPTEPTEPADAKEAEEAAEEADEAEASSSSSSEVEATHSLASSERADEECTDDEPPRARRRGCAGGALELARVVRREEPARVELAAADEPRVVRRDVGAGAAAAAALSRARRLGAARRVTAAGWGEASSESELMVMLRGISVLLFVMCARAAAPGPAVFEKRVRKPMRRDLPHVEEWVKRRGDRSVGRVKPRRQRQPSTSPPRFQQSREAKPAQAVIREARQSRKLAPRTTREGVWKNTGLVGCGEASQLGARLPATGIRPYAFP